MDKEVKMNHGTSVGGWCFNCDKSTSTEEARSTYASSEISELYKKWTKYFIFASLALFPLWAYFTHEDASYIEMLFLAAIIFLLAPPVNMFLLWPFALRYIEKSFLVKEREKYSRCSACNTKSPDQMSFRSFDYSANAFGEGKRWLIGIFVLIVGFSISLPVYLFALGNSSSHLNFEADIQRAKELAESRKNHCLDLSNVVFSAQQDRFSNKITERDAVSTYEQVLGEQTLDRNTIYGIMFAISWTFKNLEPADSADMFMDPFLEACIAQKNSGKF